MVKRKATSSDRNKNTKKLSLSPPYSPEPDKIYCTNQNSESSATSVTKTPSPPEDDRLICLEELPPLVSDEEEWYVAPCQGVGEGVPPPPGQTDVSNVKERGVELAMNDNEEAKDDQCVACGEEDATIKDEDFNWKASARPARNLAPPTLREREEHASLHMPYRGWCAHCVRGRGISSHHSMRKEGPDDKDQRVPVIGMIDGSLERTTKRPILS